MSRTFTRSKPLAAVIGAVLGALTVGATASPASAQARVEVGLLDCAVEGGAGFIFGSTKELRCEFRHSGGRTEPYFGVIKKFGIDIGATSGGFIRWVVMAPTTEIGDGALAGNYGGVSAEATVGVGLGANALVGGMDQSFALQPFSVQSQSGLNFAAGVASLELRSAGN